MGEVIEEELPASRQGQPQTQSERKVKLWTWKLIVLMVLNFASALALYLLMVIIVKFAMDTYDAPPVFAGAATTAYVGASLVSRFLFGNQIDKRGVLAMLTVGLVINLVGGLLYLVPMPYVPFLIVRCFHGVGFSLVSASAGAAAALVIPAERRAEGIAYFSMMQALATGVGPFAAVLITGDAGDYHLLFVFSAIVAAVALALAVPLRKVPELKHVVRRRAEQSAGAAAAGESAPEEHGIGKFVQLSVVPLTAVLLLVYFGYSGLVSYIVPYATDLGYETAAALFFVVYAIAILVTRPIAGRIVDKRGENAVMYFSIASVVVAFLLVAFAGHEALLLVAAVFAGFGIGTVQSIEQAIIARDTPPSEFGRANSTFLMSMDIGIGVGPMLIGAFVPFVGYSGCYLGIAVIAVGALALYHVAHGRKVARR